jgi:hypothetical protein
MKDYDAISETVFHYFEDYQTKDLERLERAFVVGILGAVYLIHHTPDPFCGFGILSPVFRVYWLTST